MILTCNIPFVIRPESHALETSVPEVRKTMIPHVQVPFADRSAESLALCAVVWYGEWHSLFAIMFLQAVDRESVPNMLRAEGLVEGPCGREVQPGFILSKRVVVHVGASRSRSPGMDIVCARGYKTERKDVPARHHQINPQFDETTLNKLVFSGLNYRTRLALGVIRADVPEDRILVMVVCVALCWA